MDAGEPSFTTHQHQSSNYISSHNHTSFPFRPTEQQLPDPDADDHGLPPGLDPDFQDPFPTSVGSYSAQSAHHRGIDRHEALNNQEGSEQEDDPEEEPIVAASARTRTHLLPPAFSSDEDEDENGKGSESESEDDRDDDLVQDRLLEQQSPEKPRSGVKRLKIVLKPKSQSDNTIESNAQDRNAMVSTRGARPASSYSEAPVEDDDQPNGTGVAEGRRASGSGPRSTRHSARRAGQGVHENGGHESDVSILKKGKRGMAASTRKIDMGQGTRTMRTRGTDHQVVKQEGHPKESNNRSKDKRGKDSEQVTLTTGAAQAAQAIPEGNEEPLEETQISKERPKRRLRVYLDQPSTVHEGLVTPPLSARPSPLIEIAIDTVRAQRVRQGAASLAQLETAESASLSFSKPGIASDNESMSSLTESLSDVAPSPSPIKASCSSRQVHVQENVFDSVCVDPTSSPDPLGAEIPPNDARALSDNQSDEDAVGEDDEDEELPQRPTRASRAAASSRPPSAARTTRSGRPTRSANYAEADEDEYDDKNGDSESESDEDEDHIGSSRSRGGGSQKRKNKSLEGFVVEDESNEESDREYGKSRRKSGGRLLRGNQSRVQALAAARARSSAANKGGASRRRSGRYSNLQSEEDDDDLITGDEDQPGYRLRERTKKVDYSLAAPPPEPLRDGMGRIVKRKSSNRSGANADTLGGAFELDARRAADLGLPHVGGAGGGRKGKTGWDALPLSMTGKDYAKAFGDEQDSSDDDIPASRKAPPPSLYGGGGSAGLLGSGPTPLGGAGGGGGAGAGNDGSARDALGRIKKGGDALADVDPLGVNMQVDFDSVGGLDGHIQQLKEMVSLPLLYPEVFTRFKVTPPRGVLFHGPPGTGKTLVARALAASCSTTGQQISFFMRKGADCLSKWVGEAERQLRMLFDEARASQPSIIFFDEIDGLAPVRSSKQDQIHASIVSTLLALMDGMDGRGQVVVIGATNRPDSVDPALRRPGRFDREFYFPLPSREARLSIINIHTKGWEPPLTDDFKDKLSEVTKGYGGADLRALCTEAALNAIQRRYPQIYQTTERLLLQPETIKVEAKDFMMSVNKLVPSSARSASSAAAPLAEHLKPILGDTVENAIQALQKVLPPATKRNPLEEALWEDEPTAATFGSEDNGFGREMMLQTFESLRIFRPRLVIYGAEGMGQSFVGGALLHHLEGYHVQSLDVGALMGDSARTPEAAVVQLFVEAKRHKPSVIYIPGLVHWAHSVSDTVRATTKALLDELTASDPILLLAIAEAPLSELPSDVARWFGYLDNTKTEVGRPSDLQRQRFFEDLLSHVSKPPTDFPDAVPRRRRVLEELPKAPPRPPRQATAAELQQQVYDDQRTLEHLKYRLGPVLGELRKKFKKFTRDVWDEYNLHNLTDTYEWHKENGKVVVRLRYTKGFRRRRHSSVDEGFLISGGDGLTSSSQRHQEATIEKPNGVVTFAEVNGSSTANQNDGPADVHMAEASTGLDGPEPTSAPSQQSVPAVLVHESQHTELNGTTTNGDNADGQASGADAAGDSSDREYDYRDMPIWTMNLERMQRRLYHNGYLTIGNFLDDLDKIVANAEQAQEVDMERMVRAHQMRNLAVVLLEQYIDINFRVECEGMAGRQLAREKEKREAEEAAKKSVEEARAAGKNPEPPRRPSGERFSARVQGQQPEHRHPVDVSAIERNSGKRSRTSSARNSGIEGSERKRARSALMNEVDQMVAQGQLGDAGDVADKVTEGQTTNGNAADPLGQPTEDVVEAVSGLGPVVVPSQTSTVAHTNGEGVAAGAEPLGTQDAASLSVPSEPLALQAHPPFVCPPLELDHLRNHLLAASKMFNIDQLLQLRAACFDGVWKRRADWDRSAMIQELEGLADKVEKAVRLELEAEGR